MTLVLVRWEGFKIKVSKQKLYTETLPAWKWVYQDVTQASIFQWSTDNNKTTITCISVIAHFSDHVNFQKSKISRLNKQAGICVIWRFSCYFWSWQSGWLLELVFNVKLQQQIINK